MSRRVGGGCPALMFYSGNANGLGSRQKLLQVLRWAESSKYSVIALQDHRLSSDPLGGEVEEEQSRIGWRGQHFFEPATARGQGVLVLMKDSPMISSVTLFAPGEGERPASLEGRHQRIDFTVGTHHLSLHNIYAPARAEDRGRFYTDLGGHAFGDSTDRCHVLCGDFNTTLDPTDRTRDITRPVPGALELGALVAAHQLVDVWRVANPTDRDFTFFSNHRSGCRLDRFYVGASLAFLPGVGSEILPTAPIATDHLPVMLTIPGPVTPDPNARSRWHFPVYVLGVPDLLEQIRSWVQGTISSAPRGNVPAWVSFKSGLETFVSRMDREYRVKIDRELKKEEKSAKEARRKLLYHTMEGESALAAVYEAAWHASRRAAEGISGRRSRSRDAVDAALNVVFGSQGINMQLKQTRSPTRISSLHDYDAPTNLPPSAAADLSTSAGMGRAYAAIVAHFSADSPTGLFRDRPGDMAAQSALLATLPRTLPPPPPGLEDAGEGLLTEADLTRALKATARGSSPGLDGIPYEFYKALWPEVGPYLRDVLNSAFLDTESDAPLALLLEGIIALIAKKGKPTDRIKSYRGLTLLGCDVKLASLAISDRMQVPLDSLIDEMQGAFIRGRDIADNILFRLGLLEYLRNIGHPAWLILTDLATAYDSVRRAYLFSCLRDMGLTGLGCLRWTVMLLSGTASSVLVNGRVLPPFPTKGGLPQGLPLSAILFVVVLHPWHSWLQTQASCGRYLRPLLPDGTQVPVLCLFADDAQHIELEEHMEQNGPVLDESYKMLEGASGVGLGIEKCMAVSVSGRAGPLQRSLRIGSREIRVADADEQVRQLGVIVSSDKGEVQRRSFGQQAGAMIGKAATWKALHPRLPERIYIALTYLISKMVFQCRFHSPSSSHQAPVIQQVIRSFIRGSDHPEETPLPGSGLQPSQGVWALPKREGGWGMPDVAAFAGAMSARGVARLFDSGCHPWKAITMHLLASAQPNLANSAAWIVTAPSLFRIGNNRLQTMATAVAGLGLHRIVHPDDQGFHSVMAEPILANWRITRGRSPPVPLKSSDLTTEEAKRWTHLREVRKAFKELQGGGERGGIQEAGRTGSERDVHLILSLLPSKWREKVTLREDDPECEWSCVGRGDRVIFEGEGGPTLFAVRHNGLMTRCEGGVAEGEPRRAAAVHFCPKPGPLPPNTAPWAAALGGIRLLGEWDKLVLDPTVWGIDKETPLHLLTVRAARVRLCQIRAVKDLPSYSIGSGILPMTWEQCPASSYPGPTPGMPTNIPLMTHQRGRGRGRGQQQQQLETAGRGDGGGGGGGGGATQGEAEGEEEREQPPRREGGGGGGGAGREPSPPGEGGGAGGEPPQRGGGGGGSQLESGRNRRGDGELGGLVAMEARWVAPRSGRAVRATSSREFEEALAASLPSWLAETGGDHGSRDRRRARREERRGLASSQEEEEGVGEDLGSLPGNASQSDRHDDLFDILHAPQGVEEGGRQGVTGVWHRLHHSGGSQAEVSLGWRLLHAALPVRAKVAYQLSKPLSEGVCQARGCSHQETLTHAFMDCLRVRGAVQWLIDLHEAITGKRPPWDPRVILADDQRIWRPGGTEVDQLLWQRLRLTTLYHIWRAQSSRQRFEDSGGDLSAAAIGGATADITASIRRDWARTRMVAAIEEAGGGHLCNPRRDLSITEDDFKAVWAQRGVLCVVSGQPSTMVVKAASSWVARS